MFYIGLVSSGVIFTVGELAFAGSIILAHNVGITMLLGSTTVVVGYLWSMARYGEELSFVSVGGTIALVWAIKGILLDSREQTEQKDQSGDLNQ